MIKYPEKNRKTEKKACNNIVANSWEIVLNYFKNSIFVRTHVESIKNGLWFKFNKFK